jgi:hypothetical protein
VLDPTVLRILKRSNDSLVILPLQLLLVEDLIIVVEAKFGDRGRIAFGCVLGGMVNSDVSDGFMVFLWNVLGIVVCFNCFQLAMRRKEFPDLLQLDPFV